MDVREREKGKKNKAYGRKREKKINVRERKYIFLVRERKKIYVFLSSGNQQMTKAYGRERERERNKLYILIVGTPFVESGR